DAEAVHRVLAGPRAAAGTLQLPLQPVEAVREQFFSNAREGVYHLVACVEGEVVGHLGLEAFVRPRRRHAGEVGVAVRDDWQGRGVGTALMGAAMELADDWLGLTRVELVVYADNAAGVALYEKFGFEVEGTHRRYAFRDGGYVDACSMARLR
ncbi:MAG TPA: GNAT family N-acetyltransferase, partial [Rubrobacter sp.]|nr:GNAT family N-acetyltransferase [Rubrobacter sp.]